MTGSISRLEHFERVDSTQRIVREWLDEGEAEICVAVAGEQTTGRGRLDRDWQAPPGRALLLSLGFRPAGLSAGHGWRLTAIVSMAMLEACVGVIGRRSGHLRLKWPNDIVVQGGERLLKVAGVLADSSSLDGRVDMATIGIGVNADWSRSDFPPDIAESMSSLRDLAGDIPVDRDVLLGRFLALLGASYRVLATGGFDATAWAEAQVTTGSWVSVDLGSRVVSGSAEGVDTDSGALLVREDGSGSVLSLAYGDVVRCRVGKVGTPPCNG